MTAGPRRSHGKRLADPNDHAVKAALRQACPTCKAEPGQWCIGVAEGRTLGRRLTRIHTTRAVFDR